LTYDRDNKKDIELKSHRLKNTYKINNLISSESLMADPMEIHDNAIPLHTPTKTINLESDYPSTSSNHLIREYRFYHPINTTKYSPMEEQTEVYYFDPWLNKEKKKERKHSRFIECNRNFAQSLQNNASLSPFRRNKELSDEITSSFWDYLQKRTRVEVRKNELPDQINNEHANSVRYLNNFELIT